MGERVNISQQGSENISIPWTPTSGFGAQKYYDSLMKRLCILCPSEILV